MGRALAYHLQPRLCGGAAKHHDPLTARASEHAFDGVTAQLEPESVILRDPKGEVNFQILEQNYRNDPVSEALLLDQFVGQSIDFEVEGERGKVDLLHGKVVRSGYVRGGSAQSPIIEVEGNLRFGLPARRSFRP